MDKIQLDSLALCSLMPYLFFLHYFINSYLNVGENYQVLSDQELTRVDTI